MDMLQRHCPVHTQELRTLLPPDPVLPTMPTFSLGRMVQEIRLRTRGRFSWYLISTSLNTTSPSWGQSVGGARPLTRAGASWDSDWDTEPELQFLTGSTYSL